MWFTTKDIHVLNPDIRRYNFLSDQYRGKSRQQSGGPVINKNGDVIGIIAARNQCRWGSHLLLRSKNIFRAVSKINKSGEADIKLPIRNHLKGHSRVQQIKAIEDFVFKVKGN